MVTLVLAFLISCALVAFMLPRILLLSLRKRLVDPIDERKVHSVPASRLGGVTFLPALLLAFWISLSVASYMGQIEWLGEAIGSGLLLECVALLSLFLVGIFDDVLGVAYRKKFVVQIFASLVVICSGTYFNTLHGFFGIETIPMYIAIPFTLFIYVFVINAINLIDGIDGLASLLSIMALLVYGVLFYTYEDYINSILSFATLGALVPFCYSNIMGVKRGASSKIFMGDTGALVIGCTLGFLAVKLWDLDYNVEGRPLDQVFYILAYTMLFIPCLDVVRVVLGRMRRKKPLFLPDKSHIHHKYMAMGLSAHKSLVSIIIMNFVFIVLNIGLSEVMNFTYVFIIDLVVWTLWHILISRRIRRVKQRS